MTEPVRRNLVSAAAALQSGAKLIDVRAPSEFQRGAPARAINLPILTDAERQRIGITYKQQGQAAAIKLGHKLVDGEQRLRRIQGWQRLAQTGEPLYLYCWRGGLRSNIAASWLADAGTPVGVVSGGYKALRQQALQQLDATPQRKHIVVLAGRTGSGKTQLLRNIAWSLDLEGIAQHRGSAFGAGRQPQPTPAGFDFRLAAAAADVSGAQILLEDESRTIGRLALPDAWFAAMQSAPVVLLEESMRMRVQNIQREYVTEPLAAGARASTLHAHFSASLTRIRRRLGGLREQQLQDLMRDGFASGRHQPWIEGLLRDYYDPMYDYQLENKHKRIIYSGSADAVTAYLQTLDAPAARSGQRQ